MEGVELAARFGSITNSLKYCGSTDFQKKYAGYLARPNSQNLRTLQNAISKFEAHYEYLKLIASENRMKPFDYEVCEAFWLGDGLLENVSREAMQKTIMRGLTGKGKMHIERAKGLAERLPEKIFAHHSFHVYYIKFITGKVEWNPENADKCRVPFGKIAGIRENEAIVDYKPIIAADGKFKFGEASKIAVQMQNGPLNLSEEFRKGDWMAFHWGVACKKLDGREKSNLEKYTLKTLEYVC